MHFLPYSGDYVVPSISMSNPLYASAVQNFVLGMLPLKLFLAENYEIIFSSERGIEKTSTNNALHDLGVFLISGMVLKHVDGRFQDQKAREAPYWRSSNDQCPFPAPASPPLPLWGRLQDIYRAHRTTSLELRQNISSTPETTKLPEQCVVVICYDRR